MKIASAHIRAILVIAAWSAMGWVCACASEPSIKPNIELEEILAGIPEDLDPQEPEEEEADQLVPTVDKDLRPPILGQVAPICTSGSFLNNGLWYVEEDFVWLGRGPLKDQLSLSSDAFSGGRITIEDVHLRWRPGARFTLGRFLGRDFNHRDQSLEFTFFGQFKWLAQSTLLSSGAGGLSSPLLTSFLGADLHRATYDSQLDSYELNFKVSERLPADRLVMAPDGTWTRQCTPSWLISYYGGVRYVKLNEQFLFFAQRNVVGTEYIATERVQTTNHLVGFQIGSDWTDQECRWNWGVRYKGGVYINFAQQNRRDFAFDLLGGSTEFLQSGLEERLAFIGELGLFATYHLHPNIALRAAYDALYLQSVALAPEQLANFGTGLNPDISLGSYLFYHGISFGVEIVW